MTKMPNTRTKHYHAHMIQAGGIAYLGLQSRTLDEEKAHNEELAKMLAKGEITTQEVYDRCSYPNALSVKYIAQTKFGWKPKKGRQAVI